MTVTITDNRTLVNDFDSTTGISSPGAGETLNVFTSDPAPAEGASCIGIAVSIETSDIVATITAVDQSAGVLVYVPVLPNGTMDTAANGGTQVIIGDGTDTIGFDIAGSDVAGFRHETGPVGWQHLLLDTGNLPAGSTAVRGAVGSLTLTAISEYGAQYKTLSKALGGASNCFTDIIRYGNGGLTIAGGTSGARGSFAEIATEDRDATADKAYGGFRELGTGIYGAQIALTFGNTGTASHYFSDTNFVVNWEDRGQADGRFDVTVQSNATGVGSFRLGEISGTENGKSGGSLIQAVAGSTFDASDASIDEVLLYDVTFKNWTGGVLLSDDATNGILHDAFDCLFDTCGTVNPGRVDVKNAGFVNPSGTVALLLEDSDNTFLKNFDFTSDGTGHAVRYRPTGAGPHSISTDGFSYNNYAATDGSTGNEAVLIDPVTASADITLTILNGTTPTIMEAVGYTGTLTVISGTVPVRVTVVDQDQTPLEGVAVYLKKVSGGAVVLNGLTNASGIVEDTGYSYTADEAVEGWVRSSSDPIPLDEFPLGGSIVSAGYSATAIMSED